MGEKSRKNQIRYQQPHNIPSIHHNSYFDYYLRRKEHARQRQSGLGGIICVCPLTEHFMARRLAKYLISKQSRRIS